MSSLTAQTPRPRVSVSRTIPSASTRHARSCQQPARGTLNRRVQVQHNAFTATQSSVTTNATRSRATATGSQNKQLESVSVSCSRFPARSANSSLLMTRRTVGKRRPQGAAVWVCATASGTGEGASGDTKRVLVPVADGSEEIETVTVVDVLRRAGAEVVLASVEHDGEKPRLQCSMSRGVQVVADVALTDVVGPGQEPFDLIAIPGGMPGAERLRDCIALDAALRSHVEAGRPAAAICAAPAVVLESKGLLQGIAATAHPAFVEALEGTPEDKLGRVIVDGSVITSRGPGTALEWSLCLVETLFGKDKMAEVAGPMVVQPANQATPVNLEWTLS